MPNLDLTPATYIPSASAGTTPYHDNAHILGADIGGNADTNAGKFTIDTTKPDLGIGGDIASLGSLAGGLAGGALGAVGSIGPEGAHLGQVPEAVGNLLGFLGNIGVPGTSYEKGNPVLGGTLGGGGAVNLGSLPGAALDVLGLPERALERTVAGMRTEAAKSGGRNLIADALAFAAGNILPGQNNIEALRQSVSGTPDTLPQDLQDKLASGEDPNKIADELVARNAGFSNNPVTNAVAGIVYDPMNLLSAGVGKVVEAAGRAGELAKAAQEAGVVVNAGQGPAANFVGRTYNVATHALTRAQQTVVEKFVGPATSGVVHAIGVRTYNRFTRDIEQVAPEFAQAFGDAMGTANGHLIRSVAAQRVAADAEKGLLSAEKFDTPEKVASLIQQRVYDMQRLDPGAVEKDTQELFMRVAAPFQGMSDAEIVAETAGKLAAATGMPLQDATRIAEKGGLKVAQTTHLGYWGKAIDGLENAKQAALTSGRKIGIDVSRLTPIARDTLTTDRAEALLGLSADAFRAEAEKYSVLRKYVGTAFDEQKVRDVIKRLADADQLPSVVKEATALKPNALPTALGDWRKEVGQFGYELGFAPKSGWRVVTDEAGNVISSDPFVHVVTDRTPVTVRNPLGQFMDSLFRGVNQSMIVLDSRARFTQRLKPLGVNAHEAEAIHSEIIHMAREEGRAPRGLALGNKVRQGVSMLDENGALKVVNANLDAFDQAFIKVLGDQRFAELVQQHSPAVLVMQAFEGNLSHVGVTQKATGAIKSIPEVGKFAAAVAEGLYPIVRFVLNPMFQAQELVESPFLNLLRGVTKETVSPEIERLYKNLSEIPDLKWVSDTEYTLNVAGGEAFKRSIGQGRIAAMIGHVTPDIRRIKEGQRISQILVEHPDEFHAAVNRIAPGLWQIMEEAAGTRDAATITRQFLAERSALTGGNITDALRVFDSAKPAGLVGNAEETVWNAFRYSFEKSATQAFKTHYFSTERGFLERSINHPYLGLYPASYMWGKVLPEFARFLLKRPFGLNAPLVGLEATRRVQEQFIAQMTSDQEFRDFLKRHGQALYLANMLLPASPTELPANAPAWLRHTSQQLASGRPVTTQFAQREFTDTANYAFGPGRGSAQLAGGVADATSILLETLQKSAAELDGMFKPQR